MVQFLVTLHKMFKNYFCFEDCKSRLVFNMGRHHLPEVGSRYWEIPSTLKSPLFKSGADKVWLTMPASSSVHIWISNKHLGKISSAPLEIPRLYNNIDLVIFASW